MQEREKLQGIYEGEDPLKKSRAIRGGLESVFSRRRARERWCL